MVLIAKSTWEYCDYFFYQKDNYKIPQIHTLLKDTLLGCTLAAASLPTGPTPSQITKQFNKGSELIEVIRFLSCSWYSTFVRAAAHHNKCTPQTCSLWLYNDKFIFENVSQGLCVRHSCAEWLVPCPKTEVNCLTTSDTLLRTLLDMRFIPAKVYLHVFYIWWCAQHLRTIFELALLIKSQQQTLNSRMRPGMSEPGNPFSDP